MSNDPMNTGKYAQESEDVVGEGHPTKSDVANRAIKALVSRLDVEHEVDDDAMFHKTITQPDQNVLRKAGPNNYEEIWYEYVADDGTINLVKNAKTSNGINWTSKYAWTYAKKPMKFTMMSGNYYFEEALTSTGSADAAITWKVSDMYLGRLIVAPHSGTGNAVISSGNNSPEGLIFGNKGDLYLCVNGGAGTCFYVKETNASNTGWVAK